MSLSRSFHSYDQLRRNKYLRQLLRYLNCFGYSRMASVFDNERVS